MRNLIVFKRTFKMACDARWLNSGYNDHTKCTALNILMMEKHVPLRVTFRLLFCSVNRAHQRNPTEKKIEPNHRIPQSERATEIRTV